jgi:predicted RecB family nuclease
VAISALSSPSALNRFLGCEYRTALDILERRGEVGAERRPPEMQLLFERGDRHEDGVVARMRADGLDVVALEDRDATKEERAERTLAAMRAGRQVLHQGCFVHEGWVGYPDFLIRVEEPSQLGGWSYEVADAKLGRAPRPKHIFQLLFYNEQLERLQGHPPARMSLILGDGTEPQFRAEDFEAYAEDIRAMFVARLGVLEGPSPDPAAAYPYPVGDCDFCHWWHVCAAKRRAEDHLSLVANLHRGQGLRLEAHGIHSLSDLVALPAGEEVPRLARATVDVLRAQADLQLRSRDRARPRFELLEPAAQTGLGRLPTPSAGDVHFDFEGDPYWGEEGLEYLFGTVYEDHGTVVYRPLWAMSRAEEKVAFETWMDWITDRLQTHPDLHVFHYNAYETVALKKLAARHATREHEVDELLRRHVFVDLYGITRQAVRAGVESYGLKGMEPVFGFTRNAELRGAIGSMKRWQAFQEDSRRAHLDDIALYNEDDCLSTRALYDWLLERRPEAEAQWAVTIDALAPEPPKPPSDTAIAHLARLEALRTRLTADLPDDESQDDPEQRARRTTFDLLGYHRREDKPVWWAFFDRRKKSSAQLRHEDRDAIGELTVVEGPEPVKQSWRWTLAFPEQEHKLSPGNAYDPDADGSGRILSVDEYARTLVYTRGTKAGEAAPTRLAPRGPYGADPQVKALLRFADRVAAHGVEPCGELDAGTDLLLRRTPRFLPATPPLTEEPFDLDRLRTQVRGLDASALVIQGPPGTGKTYTGARIAVDLLARGKRVGVMATSHKAINNVLRAIDDAADEAGVRFRGWKKGTGEDQCYESDRISFGPRPPSEEDENGRPVTLIGATAFHWAHEDRLADVETLLVDEAGQVSLADAIAVSQAARNVVLLGDPQQLAHVSQGTHPRGAGASVLAHLLDGEPTIPADRGVFLQTSWRMHPAVCSFISGAMYDGRLLAHVGCDVQRVDSPGLSGSGLRLLACEHDDNRGHSPEEAELIAAEIAKLLDGGTYVSRERGLQPLTLEDILVVAPYNAQVRCLRSTLPAGARIGTVDKFQGQQAPVVLFSMTSSSGDDVSRGMAFLFSRNRLNVAVSRAQALAVVVCSPKLLNAPCSTVDDMRLVNMLCRFARAAASG